ncbi:MAG: ribosomal subunit interface protein [Candidatus Harrisonbacteria bacterium CG10_big_fil_rev_8_21_14_0_10_38_8]|uniref:Ribosomal subunit interface protein n=1 Tax=Candidatus Harrisonbacteria bacterium CG10_big_fil_rev_8_21_14_0_10_38_8 TaxID=1974582 RepID=A0A2M6WJW5_9BACT|nr:MAG: ribosomal subunit interface protein [Candidatus Harrisonbacteria bacterium CG10_big_fil_rev_8_21_14_0_10_38_8]
MKINIKTKNFDLTPIIKEYVEEKIGSLSKLVEKYGDVIVDVEASKPSMHHNKGDKVFYAEANLDLPNKLLRAENSDFDIYVAINGVKDKLRQEILKYKDQQSDH